MSLSSRQRRRMVNPPLLVTEAGVIVTLPAVSCLGRHADKVPSERPAWRWGFEKRCEPIHKSMRRGVQQTRADDRKLETGVP